MKKIVSLLVLLFVGFSIINVDAAEVSIKSIKLIDYSGDIAEMSEPTINGLNINFDLAFSSVGDTAIYEVVLNNPTNKEYEINTDKQFSGSNYISYSYELKDKTNRIKAKSEVVLYITIKYENEVSEDSLVDGKYIENNNMGINLLNEDNPETFNNVLMIIFMILMLIIITLIFKYTKKMDLFIIVISLLVVPLTVFALDKLKITINTKIMIAEKHNVYYYGEELTRDTNQGEESSCSTLNDIVVDGEDSLYICDITRVDSKSYFEGERVKINDFNVLAFNNNECSQNAYNLLCPTDSIINTTANYFKYECNIFEEFPCNESEFEKFKFNSVISSEWYDDVNFGRIEFNSPNEFIMPNYDVVFNYYYDYNLPKIKPV